VTKKKDEAEVAVEEVVEIEAEIVEQEATVVEVVEEEAAAGEDEPTQERDELEIVKEELGKAEAQAAEYLDGWQRTRAEFSNYKKRQEAERMQTMMLASADLLRKLLPVVDDFGRAMATLPAHLDQETWFEGISLIKQKLEAIFGSEGVRSIEAEGQVFDPRYHEAVTYEEVDGYEDGQIIGEVRRGYVIGERVLRPALVRVAKAPTPPPQSEDNQDDDIIEVKE
jgi:molecular chaperone GrpE